MCRQQLCTIRAYGRFWTYVDSSWKLSCFATAGAMILTATYCIDEVLNEYRQSIFNYLCRLLDEQELAEELAIEVFVRAHRSRTLAASGLRLVLFRTATLLAMRRKRHSRQAHVPVDPSSAPHVKDALARLPENQRAVILMHKYEGLSYAQIATVLACPKSKARELLVSGYQGLRSELKACDSSLSTVSS